jgi:hypothetical protein
MSPRWIAIAVALLLTACSSTGRNFQRPSVNLLTLGQTTVADAIAAFGEPTERHVDPGDAETPTYFDRVKPRPAALRRAKVQGDIEHLRYTYTHATMTMLSDQAVARIRLLELAFWKDRLIYYHFSSSFPEDSTDFDDARAVSLVKGRTNRTDVLNLFGPPGGEGIYPQVARRGTRLYLYQYAIVGPEPGQLTLKRLELLFNAAERLEEIYLTSEKRGRDDP